MSRTPASPDFDQRIADWLEDDPDHAPGAVLGTLLAALPSIPQRRASRVPWRFQPMSRFALIGAAAATIAVVGLGGLLLASRPNGPNTGTGPNRTVIPSQPAAPTPSLTPTAAPSDYSYLPGRILMEHLGNSPDGKEPDASSGPHPERRRFYWMDPATMTGATAVEFLPGQPTDGKAVADISPDGTRIVFQDWAAYPSIWIANLDGTGLQKLETSCTGVPKCATGDPAFDPTGGRIVFVRGKGAAVSLVIRDLGTGTETELTSTRVAGSGDYPERPQWSPDGTRIAYGTVHWEGDTPKSGWVSVVDVAADSVTRLPIGLNMPGDPHWAPDGSRILVTDGPDSTSFVALGAKDATDDIYTVNPDGTDLRRLTETGQVITARYTPDGQYILYFSNYFWLVRPDGTDARPVNSKGDDLSEPNVGFGLVGHWVPNP